MGVRSKGGWYYGWGMLIVRLLVILAIAVLVYTLPLDELKAFRPYIGWVALAAGLIIAFSFPLRSGNRQKS